MPSIASARDANRFRNESMRLRHDIAEVDSRTGYNRAMTRKANADAVLSEVTANSAKKIYDLPETIKKTRGWKGWMRWDPFNKSGATNPEYDTHHLRRR